MVHCSGTLLSKVAAHNIPGYPSQDTRLGGAVTMSLTRKTAVEVLDYVEKRVGQAEEAHDQTVRSTVCL